MGNKRVTEGTGFTERLTVGIIAVVAIIAAIADAAGAFDHVQWLNNHRVDFIILLVGLSAGFLALHATRVDNLRDTIQNFSRIQQDALAASVRLVEGEDETYLELVSILRQGCRVIFLMQHGATIILGPEAQLPHEREFYRVLLTNISNGVEFYQVINPDGIRDHLLRETRYFPSLVEARTHFMADISGRAQIKVGKISVPIKQVPRNVGNIIPDKQARVLLVEHSDGTFQGLFAFNIGGIQGGIRIQGPRIKEYLTRALDFYRNDCAYVQFEELTRIFESIEHDHP